MEAFDSYSSAFILALLTTHAVCCHYLFPCLVCLVDSSLRHRTCFGHVNPLGLVQYMDHLLRHQAELMLEYLAVWVNHTPTEPSSSWRPRAISPSLRPLALPSAKNNRTESPKARPAQSLRWCPGSSGLPGRPSGRPKEGWWRQSCPHAPTTFTRC